MELYHWPMSHNARKVRAFARHLDLDVAEVELSMKDKEHKTDTFLKISPMGQIPAIKSGDYCVWEANACLIFLAAQGKEPSMLGQSAEEWGHITQWMLWQSVDLSPVVTTLHVESYFKPANNVPSDTEKQAAALDKLGQLLTLLEGAVGSGYLVSDRLTVVDFAVAGDFSHARPAKFPLNDFPKVKGWLATIEALPSWADTAPPVIG